VTTYPVGIKPVLSLREAVDQSVSTDRQVLADVLAKYFAACAAEEARRPPDEYQLLRAARARQYWLATGLVKLSPHPS
jgi:hypothetical protein